MNARITFFHSLFLLFFAHTLFLFAETRTKVFRIKNDVHKEKKMKLRKNDTVSFIPWFRMNVEIQLNYRRLYFAATCHFAFSSLRTKRTEPRTKKKSTRKNFTFGVKTVTETVCTDESYRIASLVRHLTVSKCFCETEQSTSAQIFFFCSLVCSLIAYPFGACLFFMLCALNVRNAIVSMFDFFMRVWVASKRFSLSFGRTIISFKARGNEQNG